MTTDRAAPPAPDDPAPRFAALAEPPTNADGDGDAPAADNASAELVDLARRGDRAGFEALARCLMPAADVASCWRGVAIVLEQEPGSGGKESAELSVRDLAGYDVRAVPATGSKLARGSGSPPGPPGPPVTPGVRRGGSGPAPGSSSRRRSRPT